MDVENQSRGLGGEVPHRGSQNITNGLGANLILLWIPYVDLLGDSTVFRTFRIQYAQRIAGQKIMTFEIPNMTLIYSLVIIDCGWDSDILNSQVRGTNRRFAFPRHGSVNDMRP